MCTGRFIKPTKSPIYLQKKSTSTKAKIIRSATVSPVIVHADSSDGGSGGPGEYQYVIRAKSSGNKQKNKHVNCACANCRKASGSARDPGPDKARIIVRSDSRKRCNCNGNDKDRWLCDACRAAQKKKGVMKIISCSSTSEGGSCCCHGCAGEDSKARFEREVDTWMKESKEKMKRARNGNVVCNCNRQGCKICVFVQY